MAWPEGFDLKRLQQVDSTNLEASRLNAAGVTGPLWITAEEQVQGRGRRGRQWVSKPGNLYASLLISLPITAKTAGQLGFVAALAIGDLAASIVGADDIRLKWPNDVLFRGQKMAGILSETTGDGAHGLTCIIGMGVNLAHAPGDTVFPAIALTGHEAEHSTVPEPQQAMVTLAAMMAKYLTMWDNGQNFTAIRSRWTKRAYGVGQLVKLSGAGGEQQGVINAIADDGALMLRAEDGSYFAVYAGEVSLRSAQKNHEMRKDDDEKSR